MKATPSPQIVHADTATLIGLLQEQSAERPFAIRLHAETGAAYKEAVRSAHRQFADLLARGCLGLVVVGPPAVRDHAIKAAGKVPYPFTALTDVAHADGWLLGQISAGIHGIRPAGAGKTIGLSPTLADYVQAAMSQPPDPVGNHLVDMAVTRLGSAFMTVGEDQARLLALLVELTGARRVVEVGTFIGTSALWMARALPPDGRLLCFDIESSYIDIARTGWKQAGVADRIDVIIGPALDALQALPADQPIDLAFIDADKTGYSSYLDELLPRLSPQGLIAIDNTLWSGRVVDPSDTDPDTVALRELNADLAARDDLDVLLLTIGDGLTLVRHRGRTVP
jgi:caffeoyl-CoA O-methyltransferase